MKKGVERMLIQALIYEKESEVKLIEDTTNVAEFVQLQTKWVKEEQERLKVLKKELKYLKEAL